MKRWTLFLLFCLLWAACGGSAEPAVPAATLPPQQAQGQNLFSRHCAACHATQPEMIIVGPSLAGVAGRAASRVPDLSAEEYLLQSILRPDAYLVEGYDDLMPSTLGRNLTGEELDAIVAYLLTLE